MEGMKEYIERCTTLSEIDRAFKIFSEHGDVVTLFSDVRAAVIYATSADVVEVRHGRWEKFSTASGIISRVRCSVCSGTQPLTFESMPYCPNCGARMDKEDDHEEV